MNTMQRHAWDFCSHMFPLTLITSWVSLAPYLATTALLTVAQMLSVSIIVPSRSNITPLMAGACSICDSRDGDVIAITVSYPTSNGGVQHVYEVSHKRMLLASQRLSQRPHQARRRFVPMASILVSFGEDHQHAWRANVPSRHMFPLTLMSWSIPGLIVPCRC
jgi:hypothetical protein